MSNQAKVITYTDGSGGKINITEEQKAMLEQKGIWPHSGRGAELCQVSRGLHLGEAVSDEKLLAISF